MRLKPEKIEQLAELVYDALGTHEEMKLQGERENVIALIRNTITEDLEEEDRIKDEAASILEEHADDIRRTGANYNELHRKTVQKLARDKGMVL